jgi:hypothetical protein
MDGEELYEIADRSAAGEEVGGVCERRQARSWKAEQSRKESPTLNAALLALW